MKRLGTGVLVVLMVLLMSPGVWSATLNVPGAYASIQEAIDSAVDGDLIQVAAGTYSGDKNVNLDTKGKSITILGVDGPTDTIIDCGHLARGFHIHSGETFTTRISGFTIRNGDTSVCTPALKGGAILCENESGLTLHDCHIEQNKAEERGGGLYCEYANVIIQSCKFTDNEAGENGGAATFYYCSLGTIEDSDFALNRATNTNGNAGGVEFSACNMTVYDCKFTENSGYFGGSIWTWNSIYLAVIGCEFSENTAQYGPGLYGGGGRTYLFDSSFSQNKAGDSGGGVYCDDAMAFMMQDCSFDQNSADLSGGALALSNSYATEDIVNNCTFTNNTGHLGGAIYCSGSSHGFISNCTIDKNSATGKGGGVYFYTLSEYRLSNCTISNCSADEQGGGVYIHQYGHPLIFDTTFQYNSSLDGGAIFSNCTPWSAEVFNCLFLANSAASNGGAIFTQSDPALSVRNSTFDQNTCVDLGQTYYYEGSNGAAANCIIRGTGDHIQGVNGSLDITYSNIEGGYTGNGNIGTDPIFVTGPGGSYYLSSLAAGETENSPCLDTGSGVAASACTYNETVSVCADKLFTRSDHVSDSGTVDMGYHYCPQKTVDPASDLMEIYLQLLMPSDTIYPGDVFRLDAQLRSVTGDGVGALFFVILEIYGELYFYPQWQHYAPPDYPVGFDVLTVVDETISIFPEFVWPETGAGLAGLHFMAATTNAEGSALNSNLVDLEWTFMP